MFAPEDAPERYADTPIVGLAAVSLPIYPEFKLVPPVVDVRDRLAAFAPDVIHVVNPVSLGLVGLRHARQLGVPAVASYQTDLPGYARLYGFGVLRNLLWEYLRWVHSQADLNLCPSDYTLKQLRAHGFERLRVWTRGVETDRFHPRHRSAHWRWRLSRGHPHAPLLIYVGRLATEKRVEWLRPVMDALPGVRLAIVGDGPARAGLERLFHGTHTVFTGYLRGQDLANAYASADLFVLTGANETFGNVVLEAMASGLPVVAPAAGGQTDRVRHGLNGVLYAPESQASLVRAVRQLATDRALLRRVARSARLSVESLGWADVLDGLLEDYRSVIGQRRQKLAA
jgi:glycosyltransferase involved in cell wall biosynthesis